MRRSSSENLTATDTKRMRNESDKAQLYDRQLRLWQKTGQAALEGSRVCVLGSSALAAEALKNLVLPGIGELVVIDDARVNEQDIKTNFFVRPDDKGKPRAQCIVENLSELNPDVRGSAIVMAPTDVVTASSSEQENATILLDAASLVIACNQPESLVCKISQRCWTSGTPLIVANSAGFLARIRTSVAEHAVIESHVDTKPDLRLMCPFPALRSHVDSINLDTLDSTDLAHVPYIVLIIKALQKFASKHSGNADASGWEGYPSSLKWEEKSELRALIRQLATVKPDEENFEEATNSVMPQCVRYEIPTEIKVILEDPAASVDSNAAAVESQSNMQQINSKFWLLANALRRYVESDYAQGKLPLSGKIPDMKADTSGYIALQRIYKEKAEQDKNELIKHVADVLTASRLPADFISQEEIDIFAKNANLLRLVRTSSVHNEYANGPSDLDMLSMNELLSHYALFRASDAFFSKHVRYPGAPAPSTEQAARSSLTAEDLNKLVESDTSELVGMANELLAKWQPNNHENGGQKNTVSDELAAEFARSGHCELHNVASVCGGVIAQEAIKLITHQYVPGNNIFVFDGVQGRLLSAKV